MNSAVSAEELVRSISESLRSLQKKAKSVADGAILPNLTITSLTECAKIKKMHLTLQKAAHSARAASFPAQQAAAASALELENARYESRALERELEQCATMPTPHLNALGLKFLTGDGPEVHKETLAILQSELDRRIELSARVAALKKERDERARRVRKAEESLQSLPKRVRRLAAEAQPLRKFFLAEEGSEVSFSLRVAPRPSDIGLTQWAQLPGPLYVLARQALAFSASSVPVPVMLNVRAKQYPTPSDSKTVGKPDATSLHQTHQWGLDLNIKETATSTGGSALRAGLSFQYHPELNIVSLKASSDDISASQLCDLYPHDSGRKSPNPANAYLLDGKFAFNCSLAGGRNSVRAFQWANALCGLHFLPEKLSQVSSDHIRFSDAMARVLSRMRVVQALRTQIRSLKKKASAKDETRMRKFEVESSANGFKLPISMEDATVYKVECSAGSIKKRIVARFAVPASYPVPSPIIFLERGGVLGEANIRRIENEVNNVQDANERTLFISQVDKLLQCVSVLGTELKVVEGDDDGQNSTRQFRGRGRVMVMAERR